MKVSVSRHLMRGGEIRFVDAFIGVSLHGPTNANRHLALAIASSLEL